MIELTISASRRRVALEYPVGKLANARGYDCLRTSGDQAGCTDSAARVFAGQLAVFVFPDPRKVFVQIETLQARIAW